MPDIKIKQKEKNEIPIKKIDRKAIYKTKLKDNLINIKERNNTNENEDTNPNNYSINRISKETRIATDKAINNFDRYGRKATRETIQNIKNGSQNIKQKIQNRSIKQAEKTARQNIKTSQKTIKKAEQTGKATYKTTGKTIKGAYKTGKKTAKATVKGAKKTYQIAKATAKATAKGIKLAVKATIATIKAIIAGTKALISAIIAGGWVAFVIIILICLIALICSSIFGIFFSSEDGVGDKTMSSVISEINIEFTNKITDIQKNNEHDEYEIKSNRAEWKDILCVYTVLVSNGDDRADVVTLDDNKINKLKTIFWEMNIITSKVETQEKEIETTDDKGNMKKEKVKKKILYIDIQNKSVDEMIQKYNFNSKQREQIAELQKDEYNYMWSYVLYGTSTGSSDIVKVALAQVGNVGGQPYWSWYGFNSRVEWCACFVSWCANECGYIESGTIPKFAGCESEGVAWFKTCGLWQEQGYTPKARRYHIF